MRKNRPYEQPIFSPKTTLIQLIGIALCVAGVAATALGGQPSDRKSDIAAEPAAPAEQQKTEFKLASVFTSGMVLQRDMAVPVWGRAVAGTKVSVSFAGQSVDGVADPKGHWSVTLKPLEASAEGRTLNVVSSAGTLTCKNVLVGEVWLCSGQSNMEMALRSVLNAADEVAAAQYPNIRLLNVPRRAISSPDPECPNAAWTACEPETVERFSAVGYYFGRELHRRLQVPVGLIHSSWGGTPARAWTSRSGLMSEPSLHEIVKKADENPFDTFKERHASWVAAVAEHDARTADVENLGFSRGWADLPEPSEEWSDMVLPAFWQTRGPNISGILWFRKVVDVPEEWAGKDLVLSIGAVDKSETTYFNNEMVGSLSMQDRPDAWAVLRTYKVPGRLVKAGRNIIAVRARSNKYAGGFTGPAKEMRLVGPSDTSVEPIALDGTWRYAVEKSYGLVQMAREPEEPRAHNQPGFLFNGMISFVSPFSMRGVIWYQGEADSGRPQQYRTLFPALIRDWRRVWARDDMAFYFVQLANFMAVKTHPAESNWARLREAQTMALSLPHTGMAVAIDIGDADDIHPTNKQDVGFRLALNALHQTYGLDNVVPSGPLFRSAQRDGKAIRIEFDQLGGGLTCRGAELTGFAIAGEDREFVWADARIDGESVLVSSASVSEPVAVRYAWADNPVCNLYNYAGLPTSPFRTDEW